MSNYTREYYYKNREKLLERNRAWRKVNREKIRAAKKIYQARPDQKLKKQERSARDYEQNKEKYRLRQAKRRRDRKSFMDAICLFYNCQNPNCKWAGEFIPSQLDFHHFKPETKIIEVAKMESWSYDNIIAEIDKCVVVCRNCHPLVHNGCVTLTEDKLCKSEDYLKAIQYE